MMKLHRIFYAAALLAISVGLSGCKDEIIPDIYDNKTASRGAYDYPAVEWDNVDYIKVRCNQLPSDTILPLPWESGSSGNGEIPYDWINFNPKDPNPKNRAYSRENGWEMIMHNLLNPTEPAKYFGLYNKFTGVLRLFFYEMKGSTSDGTSQAWFAFRIQGPTSLMNFTGTIPKSMSDIQMNPVFISSTEGDIADSIMSTTGYKSGKWFGFELELAYDENASSANKITAKLWGQNCSRITLSGTNKGSINGSVQTTYSNSPSNISISPSINVGNTTYNVTETKAKEALTSDTTTKKANFIKKILSKLDEEIPNILSNGVKAGIETLCTGGASLITKGLSKILGLSGRGSMPMSSTSKVDLGLDSKINVEGIQTSDVVGWGSISDFMLPQFAPHNNLFSGRLGVWNLRDYPKVKVDLMMTSMFYPKDLVPNPDRPRAAYATYTFTLSGADLIINPDLLIDYKVENLTQTLVYTANARLNFFGECDDGKEYGIDGDKEYYKPLNSRPLKIVGRTVANILEWDPNNPESSYSHYWDKYAQPMTNHDIMCHVYFELVSKSDSNERYAYSKYFPCTAVKGNFSHREEIITK